MKASFIISLLPLLTSPLVSAAIECYDGRPLPPYQDCAATLRALDMRWRHPPENRQRFWGRLAPSVPLESENLPEAFFMSQQGRQTQRPKKCEFFVDNVEGHEREVEEFSLQALTAQASQIVRSCLTAGKLGRGNPGNGTVYVAVRYRNIFLGDEDGSAIEPAFAPEEGQNVTQVPIQPVAGGGGPTAENVPAPDVSMIPSKRWQAYHMETSD